MIRHAGQSPLFPGAVDHGGLLATSGVVAPEALAGARLSFDDEVMSALEELHALLARAGRDVGDVMRIEVYLADSADFSAWNNVFSRQWPDPERRPARTTLTVEFALPTIRFEIQALVAGAVSAADATAAD